MSTGRSPRAASTARATIRRTPPSSRSTRISIAACCRTSAFTGRNARRGSTPTARTSAATTCTSPSAAGSTTCSRPRPTRTGFRTTSCSTASRRSRAAARPTDGDLPEAESGDVDQRRHRLRAQGHRRLFRVAAAIAVLLPRRRQPGEDAGQQGGRVVEHHEPGRWLCGPAVAGRLHDEQRGVRGRLHDPDDDVHGELSRQQLQQRQPGGGLEQPELHEPSTGPISRPTTTTSVSRSTVSSVRCRGTPRWRCATPGTRPTTTSIRQPCWEVLRPRRLHQPPARPPTFGGDEVRQTFTRAGRRRRSPGSTPRSTSTGRRWTTTVRTSSSARAEAANCGGTFENDLWHYRRTTRSRPLVPDRQVQPDRLRLRLTTSSRTASTSTTTPRTPSGSSRSTRVGALALRAKYWYLDRSDFLEAMRARMRTTRITCCGSSEPSTSRTSTRTASS